MITIATPVQLPAAGFNRIRIVRAPLELDSGAWLVRVQAGNAATSRLVDYDLVVSNGPCHRLEVNPSPRAFDDAVRVAQFAVNVATGADQVEAIMRSAYASKAAQSRALETALLTMGCIAAELTGTVS